MDLIERLSAATGKDPELDTLIHEAIHGPLGKLERPQRYTASLDAAMTLVPDGWWCEAHIRPDAPGVVLWQFPLPCQRVPAERPYQIAGRTAPLALCIAALKARQTTASST
jgi:hypothetical protein